MCRVHVLRVLTFGCGSWQDYGRLMGAAASAPKHSDDMSGMAQALLTVERHFLPIVGVFQVGVALGARHSEHGWPNKQGASETGG